MALDFETAFANIGDTGSPTGTPAATTSDASPAVEAAPAESGTPAVSSPPASSDPQLSAAAPEAAPAPAEPGHEEAAPKPPSNAIPLDRHQAVIENTRTKTREEVLSQYGGATPEQVQQYAGVLQTMAQDPIGFVRQFLSELSAHPDYGQEIRSLAARTMRTPSAQVADEPPPPDIEVNGHQWYSAEQQAKRDAWVRQSIKRELQDELKQSLAPVEELKREREQVAIRQRADQVSGSLYEQAKAWPGFTAHEAAIAEALKARPQQEPLALALTNAYTAVLQSTILPSNEASLKAKVLAELKAGTPAASAVNPALNGAAATTRASAKTFAEYFDGL